MQEKKHKGLYHTINRHLFSHSIFGGFEIFISYTSMIVLGIGAVLSLFSVTDSFFTNPLFSFGISGLLLEFSITCMGAGVTWGDDFPIGRALINLLVWKRGLIEGVPFVAVSTVFLLGWGAFGGCLFCLFKGIHKVLS